jgi:predicted membrane protein (TIGR00267 family)
MIGAAAPIFPYAMLPLGHALALSVGLTLVALFAIGAAKAQMSHKKWLRSGLEMMVTGGAGALICYFIGKVVAHVAGSGRL